MKHVFIDLSPDSVKYKTVFVGLTWQNSLPWGVLEKIRMIFGYDIPSTLLLRRKTRDELVNHCLTIIRQKNLDINVNDHNLRSRLSHYIGRGETCRFEWQDVEYHLSMKW